MYRQLTMEEIKANCICINRSHLVQMANGDWKRLQAGEDCCGTCYPTEKGFQPCPYARMAENEILFAEA